MRALIRIVPLLLVVLVLGCGKDDPNKNLKPIDPNTPPPKPASEGKKVGSQPLDKPSGIVK
ncbi:MAG TPA: hypothetical protein VGJ05_11090 [Fimbriiglobus sp.]